MIANWKMHKTQEEARAFIDTFFSYGLPDDRIIGIAASATLLPLLGELLYHRDLFLAGQNIYFEPTGAYTGEISPLQLQDTGATHVLIGHSERRILFGETDEMIGKKVAAAQKYGISPIYCVGETDEEKKSEKTERVIRSQIEMLQKSVSPDFLKKVIIAYEPVWAIGTGESSHPQDAQEVHALIRSIVGEETPIIYGGSVTTETAASLLSQKDVDGFLVGGASLDPHTFFDIVKTIE